MVTGDAGGEASGRLPAADAEEALCRGLASRIFAYGIKHLRDPDDAADLVQQVLLVVVEALRAGRVRDPDQIGSYVLGTSRRLALDLRRTRRRREALTDQYAPGTLCTAVEPPPLPETTRVADCLAQLSHTARRVVVMTFYEDASGAEIAGALDVSAGNVRVIRHRALEALRHCIEPAPAARGGAA